MSDKTLHRKGERRTSASGGFRIDREGLERTLAEAAGAPPERAREVLDQARELKGLTPEQTAVLLACDDPAVCDDLFATARAVKEAIYGNRLVLFAPLYITNRCVNDCRYCSFRTSNRELRRRQLDQDEIAQETRILIGEGHKRVLLVAGEGNAEGRGLEYVRQAIATVYGVKEGPDEIRRINVNIAPLTEEGFGRLRDCGIGTYQLFQETYHEPTYIRMHPGGPKADFDWRLTTMDRALAAGLDDVGIGVLFGLYDWRFEVLALLEHARHLDTAYGVGPHTISVPRLMEAVGADTSVTHAATRVSDHDFQRLVAILRLAVPYTGLIMSTRESAAMRAATFALGVSQISASSRTDPGGYDTGPRRDDPGEPCAAGQFQLGDHRNLDEVVADIFRLGYLPSFCTGCYRLGRTGEDFMDLAKPGLIKRFCLPNALLTTQEFLRDHASTATREAGQAALTAALTEVPGDDLREEVRRRLQRTTEGENDLFF